jgi:hypothetical protein
MSVATLSSKEHSLIIWLDPAKNTYERIGIVLESRYSRDRQLRRLPWTNQAKCFYSNYHACLIGGAGGAGGEGGEGDRGRG